MKTGEIFVTHTVNIIYTKENELLNGMPYYVDNERKYAIWFDGREWVIGYFSDLEEGKFITGVLSNGEFIECPTDTNDWQERFDDEGKCQNILVLLILHTNLTGFCI